MLYGGTTHVNRINLGDIGRNTKRTGCPLQSGQRYSQDGTTPLPTEQGRFLFLIRDDNSYLKRNLGFHY